MSKSHAKLIHKLRERDGNTCHYCGKVLEPAKPGYNPNGASVDHIQPKSQGGTDDLDNLVLACRDCNAHKHTRSKEEFTLQRDTNATLLWLMEGNEL